MNKPVLLIMAAGLGSRYGGLKQMDTVGDNGEWLIDFSLYDAYEAGFRDVVFVVNQEILEDFKETIGKRVEKKLSCEYVVQSLGDIPTGFSVPQGREKPWGTAHAIYVARSAIGERPFMVINADDYYGASAFRTMFSHLSDERNQDFSMIGYLLENTVTDSGTVARGVCIVQRGLLSSIVERTNIGKFPEGIKFSEDGGNSWQALDGETIVSLNCWGFSKKLFKGIEAEMPNFFRENVEENPLKAELFLPAVVENMIANKNAQVQVLSTAEKWYGMTYHEDRKQVSEALKEMKGQNKYPHNLWQ